MSHYEVHLVLLITSANSIVVLFKVFLSILMYVSNVQSNEGEIVVYKILNVILWLKY